MKREELIIGMYRGVLSGVYSLNPTLVDVRLNENEDQLDRERLKEFWRNQVLVEHGCVSDICGEAAEEEIKPMSLHLDEKQNGEFLSLFADNPAAQTKLYFLEGFLYSWAMVNQKITGMCRSAEESDMEKGKELYKAFAPTLQSWLDTYDELFDDLWQYADTEEAE